MKNFLFYVSVKQWFYQDNDETNDHIVTSKFYAFAHSFTELMDSIEQQYSDDTISIKITKLDVADNNFLYVDDLSKSERKKIEDNNVIY